MANQKANHMNSSISVRSVARRTFATYAGQASVLLPVAAITVVIVAALGARPNDPSNWIQLEFARSLRRYCI
jgi:hypothetical protein